MIPYTVTSISSTLMFSGVGGGTYNMGSPQSSIATDAIDARQLIESCIRGILPPRVQTSRSRFDHNCHTTNQRPTPCWGERCTYSAHISWVVSLKQPVSIAFTSLWHTGHTGGAVHQLSARECSHTDMGDPTVYSSIAVIHGRSGM